MLRRQVETNIYEFMNDMWWERFPSCSQKSYAAVGVQIPEEWADITHEELGYQQVILRAPPIRND